MIPIPVLELTTGGFSPPSPSPQKKIPCPWVPERGSPREDPHARVEIAIHISLAQPLILGIHKSSYIFIVFIIKL